MGESDKFYFLDWPFFDASEFFLGLSLTRATGSDIKYSDKGGAWIPELPTGKKTTQKKLLPTSDYNIGNKPCSAKPLRFREYLLKKLALIILDSLLDTSISLQVVFPGIIQECHII